MPGHHIGHFHFQNTQIQLITTAKMKLSVYDTRLRTLQKVYLAH